MSSCRENFALTVVKCSCAVCDVEGGVGVCGVRLEITIAQVHQVDRIEFLNTQLLSQLIRKVILDIGQRARDVVCCGGRNAPSFRGKCLEDVVSIVYIVAYSI